MKADFSCVTRKVFPKEELQDVCSEHGSHCEFSICVCVHLGWKPKICNAGLMVLLFWGVLLFGCFLFCFVFLIPEYANKAHSLVSGKLEPFFRSIRGHTWSCFLPLLGVSWIMIIVGTELGEKSVKLCVCEILGSRLHSILEIVKCLSNPALAGTCWAVPTEQTIGPHLCVHGFS